ncbi:MAG: hypothetical protein KY394_05190 [Actinobacteria bacterium]|nr:hypothetical protein [Actinomycetota bacterium]
MTDPHTETEVVVERGGTTGYWRSWSPAQPVAGIIGLLLTVMGGVALARLIPTSSLTAETTSVFGIGHTPLMAMITLGVGLLFLAQAGMPFDVQPGIISLGIAVLAFGLIVVIEPAAFDGALGLGRSGGWFYAITGLVAVITGIVSPTLVSRRP